MRQYAASITEETVTVCDGCIRTFTGRSGEEDVSVDGTDTWATVKEAVAAATKWAGDNKPTVTTAGDGSESMTYHIVDVYAYDDEDEDEGAEYVDRVKTISDGDLEVFERRILAWDNDCNNVAWEMEDE